MRGILKRALLLRGLVRRAKALLAMTGVRWKGEGCCREVNHPEPFLTKRPTPPKEGNKVGLCFEGSAAVQIGPLAGGMGGRHGRKRRKVAPGGNRRK